MPHLARSMKPCSPLKFVCLRSVPIRVAIVMLASVAIWSANANAQNGRLIEDLFRTFAEAKIEKERQKRAQAQKRPPVLLPPGQSTITPSKDPYEVRLPPGFGSPSRPNRVPGTQATPNLGSINVRSAQARDYAQQLAGFNTTIAPLINDLRGAAGRHPQLRPLLPEIYQIAADGRTLLNRCNGLSTLNTVVQPYQQLDARWRQASFALRSINGLSADCVTAIGRCDQYCASMCKQLQLQPQFDRRALHEQMLIAATHLQTISDDLELTSISSAQCNKLTHDCRLLRQRLIAAARNIDEYSYEEIAARFTRFVEDWRSFAQQVYALRNPHLNRRLARVTEVGDRTYAILWMSPPPVMHNVSDVARRLTGHFSTLGDRVSFRSLSGLPSQDQVRLLGAMPKLNQIATTLSQAAARNAQQQELARIFGDLDSTWVSVESDFARLTGVNRGLITEIERCCDELRRVLGSSGRSTYLSASQLIQSAAALEGSSEFIYRELQRLRGKLEPSSYRNDITNGSREFYSHSKELHEEISKPGRLSDPRYLERIQRETKRMVEGWNDLTKHIGQIQARGVSRTDASRLQRAYRDIQPHVAQIAAALLQN